MERGTPKWAFNMLRTECLAGFLQDIRALEADGLPQKPCETVHAYLKRMAESLQRIPVARPPGKAVAVDFQEFAELYHEWNNKEGSDPEIRRIRSRAYDNLQRKKKRLVDRIGDSLPELKSEDVTWEAVDQVVDLFNQLTNDKMLEGKFKYLKMSLIRFNNRVAKYKTA